MCRFKVQAPHVKGIFVSADVQKVRKGGGRSQGEGAA